MEEEANSLGRRGKVKASMASRVEVGMEARLSRGWQGGASIGREEGWENFTRTPTNGDGLVGDNFFVFYII